MSAGRARSRSHPITTGPRSPRGWESGAEVDEDRPSAARRGPGRAPTDPGGPVTTPRNIVIVGGGLAGAKAAEALRDEGYDGRLVLLGEEHRRPYERPPLSKDYLRGEAELASAYVHEPGWYDAQSVELRTGTVVTAIDRAAHEVELDDGERIGWDRLLIATGAEPRRLPLPGADLDGVLYLRSVEDSDRLKRGDRGRRQAGGGRRRVDRLRGGGVRAPGGHGGDGARAPGRPARDGPGPNARRPLRRHPSRPRRRAAHGRGDRGPGGRRTGGAGAPG